jgi:hypothetical protein
VNVAVGKLRAALGDSAENPSFIETVPRRGYRFVARLDEGPVDTHPQLPAINGVRPSRVVSVFDRTLLALLAVVISGILVGSGVFLGHRTTKWQPPDFQRLTVSRGTVYSARFALDGHSVIYAASWDGGPTEIFSTDPKIPGARSLGLPATQLLAVSSSGEMAVLQPIDYRFLLTGRGTLGQVPLTGGSPRRTLLCEFPLVLRHLIQCEPYRRARVTSMSRRCCPTDKTWPPPFAPPTTTSGCSITRAAF